MSRSQAELPSWNSSLKSTHSSRAPPLILLSLCYVQKSKDIIHGFTLTPHICNFAYISFYGLWLPERIDDDEPARKRLKKNSYSDQHSFTLKHGSLLVMRGYTQRDWIHSVPKRTRVEATRVNLTFRLVVWWNPGASINGNWYKLCDCSEIFLQKLFLYLVIHN